MGDMAEVNSEGGFMLSRRNSTSGVFEIHSGATGAFVLGYRSINGNYVITGPSSISIGQDMYASGVGAFSHSQYSDAQGDGSIAR